jgi:DNA repair protein RecO (recombination protein O)
MHEERVEGIILRVTPYKDRHRVVTLFTPQSGMVTFLAKKVSTPEKTALLSPFSCIEAVMFKKQSDLYHFKEGALLEGHLFLRTKWTILEMAGKMAQILLHSQLPGKSSPLLYALFKACLKQLPLFEDPSSLLLFFYLKLLTHEGILCWSDPATFPLPCKLDEWKTMKEWAECRQFQPLRQKKIPTSLLGLLEENLKNLV